MLPFGRHKGVVNRTCDVSRQERVGWSVNSCAVGRNLFKNC
jgi:hypothetical protein